MENRLRKKLSPDRTEYCSKKFGCGFSCSSLRELSAYICCASATDCSILWIRSLRSSILSSSRAIVWLTSDCSAVALVDQRRVQLFPLWWYWFHQRVVWYRLRVFILCYELGYLGLGRAFIWASSLAFSASSAAISARLLFCLVRIRFVCFKCF